MGIAANMWILHILVVYHLLTSVGEAKIIRDGKVVLSEEESIELHEKAYIDCYSRIYNTPFPTNISSYCNRTWDGVTCWDDTPAGVEAIQPCPHFHGFRVNSFVTRQCMSDSTWFYNDDYNTTWSNYTACMDESRPKINLHPILSDHTMKITTMSNIGYGLSLVSLTVAIITMIYFRKLHCPRNTVHMNLFVAFLLRAFIALLKNNLFVEHLGLPKDVSYDTFGTIMFIEEGPHWECRLILTLFHLCLLASYMWIFVEGLYLHMLIFVSVFSENSRVTWYLLLGWGTPFIFIIPWIVLRIYLENEYCWNINDSYGFIWIIKTPIVITNFVNLIFFFNIVGVLFTKLRAPNAPETRRYRYRFYMKLAKSTLVLIPLFGVHSAMFIVSEKEWPPHVEAALIWVEMLFNSFQGFLVALLFCFCNGDVQAEIKKKWTRFQMSRGRFRNSGRASVSNTLTSYVAKGRSSSHSIQSMEKVEPFNKKRGNCLNTSNATITSNGLSSSNNKMNSTSILKNCNDNKEIKLYHNIPEFSDMSPSPDGENVGLVYEVDTTRGDILLEPQKSQSSNGNPCPQKSPEECHLMQSQEVESPC